MSLLKNLTVEKQQRVEGLVLGGSAHMGFGGQARKKSSDLRFTHLRRMSFVVEEDKSFDPMTYAFSVM